MNLKETDEVVLLEPAVDSVIAFLLFLVVPREKGSGVPTETFVAIFVRRLERIRRGGGRGRMLRGRVVGSVVARGTRGGATGGRGRGRRQVVSSSSGDRGPRRRRRRPRKPRGELASGEGGEPRGRLAELARQAEVSEEMERLGSGREIELAEEWQWGEGLGAVGQAEESRLT